VRPHTVVHLPKVREKCLIFVFGRAPTRRTQLEYAWRQCVAVRGRQAAFVQF
jgi:hypothetical protein